MKRKMRGRDRPAGELRKPIDVDALLRVVARYCD
jgi:hypothetical protein